MLHSLLPIAGYSADAVIRQKRKPRRDSFGDQRGLSVASTGYLTAIAERCCWPSDWVVGLEPNSVSMQEIAIFAEGARYARQFSVA